MTFGHVPSRRRERAVRIASRVGRVLGVVIVALAIVAGVAGMALLAAWPPLDRVVTGATPEYPHLQPRAWAFSRDRVVAAVGEAVATLPRYTLREAPAGDEPIRIAVRVPWGDRVDDMLVRVEANGDGGTIVFVEAWTDEGAADFGQNARNILALYDAIEGRLGLR